MRALLVTAVLVALGALVFCAVFVSDYWQLGGYRSLVYALAIVLGAAWVGGLVSVSVLLWRRV